MLKTLAFIFLTAFLTVAYAQDFSSGTWVDLTHTLNEEAVFWPTANMYEQETIFKGETDGYYSSAFNFIGVG